MQENNGAAFTGIGVVKLAPLAMNVIFHASSDLMVRPKHKQHLTLKQHFNNKYTHLHKLLIWLLFYFYKILLPEKYRTLKSHSQ
jgi:hypothetical protein